MDVHARRVAAARTRLADLVDELRDVLDRHRVAGALTDEQARALLALAGVPADLVELD